MSISEEEKRHFEALAICGAKKVCTETCSSTNNCGRKHNPWPVLTPINPEFKCPLTRFEFERKAIPAAWWEVPRCEREPTDEELFALCATCEHGQLKEGEDDTYFVDTESEFMTACIDCVVKDIMDARAETEAEARSS